MRIALCVRRNTAIFRLVWLNESKDGIYIGVLGSEEDSHWSYHRDGTRHTKIGVKQHNRFSDTPIDSHVGFKQLGHWSLSLTKNWFNKKTTYSGDSQTESIVVIDEFLLSGKDTLALDFWLTDRKSELELLETIAKHIHSHSAFQVVAELVSSLDHFPEHKVAITLRSAKVREVGSNQLMFPDITA